MQTFDIAKCIGFGKTEIDEMPDFEREIYHELVMRYYEEEERRIEEAHRK